MVKKADELKIDLGKPERSNLLAETSLMPDADNTDYVDALRVLSIGGPGGNWEVSPAKNNTTRLITYNVLSGGSHHAQLIFNTETGGVQLKTPTGAAITMPGVKVHVLVKRGNLNRAPQYL